jgi:hypothetical protein
LALRRQPAVIDKYNLTEFRIWQQNNESAFRSKSSVFLQYEFLNYYQEITGVEVFVLLLDLGEGDFAYMVFDKKVDHSAPTRA